MKNVHIFFDLDDTLIITNIEFERVVEKTATLTKELLGLEVSLKEIAETFNQIDLKNALKHGLGKERFPNAWVETYRYYSGKIDVEAKKEHEEQVHELAKSIHTKKFKSYSGIYEVLDKVKSTGCEMNILTAGTDDVQRKRIDDAEITHYFDNIYVSTKKTPEVFKEIVGDRNMKNTIMIGNSLRSDIFPALENNAVAIHIDRETWDYDHMDIDTSNPNYIKIQDIRELPAVLEGLVGKYV